MKQYISNKKHFSLVLHHLGGYIFHRTVGDNIIFKIVSKGCEKYAYDKLKELKIVYTEYVGD